MRKEIRHWAIAAAGIMVLLGGCQGQKYQKIEVPGHLEASEKGQGQRQETEEERMPIVILEAGDTEEVSGNLSGGFVSADAAAGEAVQRENEEAGLTLLFGGDVLLSDHVLTAYDKAGGIGGVVDEGYRNVIGKADFFMVNQEFPFSSRGEEAPDKQFTFRLAPERVSLFSEMGIDGVTLANNHALDFGREALMDSCETLDRAGIVHTGAGGNLEAARRPVIVEQKGKRIAVIGPTRVIPTADWAAGKQVPGMLAAYDMAILLEEIQKQRQENDFVVVYVHWGIEKEEKPQDYQRSMGRQMIDAGADLVIGAHPHVLQGIEYYKGKAIVYSLGNFVFGSSIPRTALLKTTWNEGKEPVLRLIPGTSAKGYTRMLTDEADRQEFFRYIENISEKVTFQTDGTVIPPGEEKAEE